MAKIFQPLSAQQHMFKKWRRRKVHHQISKGPSLITYSLNMHPITRSLQSVKLNSQRNTNLELLISILVLLYKNVSNTSDLVQREAMLTPSTSPLGKTWTTDEPPHHPKSNTTQRVCHQSLRGQRRKQSVWARLAQFTGRTDLSTEGIFRNGDILTSQNDLWGLKTSKIWQLES